VQEKYVAAKRKAKFLNSICKLMCVAIVFYELCFN